MIPKFKFEIKGQNELAVRFKIKQNEQYLTFKDVFELWSTNSEFVEFYTKGLINLAYQAFYWEHPALKKEFLVKNYECILHKSKPLEDLPANETAFKDFLHKKEPVVDFMNIGKNARLVIPTKKTDKEIYNHLGKFIRLASKEQVTELFKKVGATITGEIEKQKLIWLNTAGLGVIWLHIRLDTRPKYYKTKKYKNPELLDSIK